MSAKDDRIRSITHFARELRDFKAMNTGGLTVTLSRQDYDFMLKHKKIVQLSSGNWLDGDIKVQRR